MTPDEKKYHVSEETRDDGTPKWRYRLSAASGYTKRLRGKHELRRLIEQKQAEITALQSELQEHLK